MFNMMYLFDYSNNLLYMMDKMQHLNDYFTYFMSTDP
jgi:hypothetical protein